MTVQTASSLSGIETGGVLPVWPPTLPAIDPVPEVSLKRTATEVIHAPVADVSARIPVLRTLSHRGLRGALIPAALTSVAAHGLVWAMLATAPAKQIGEPAEKAVSVEIMVAPLPDTMANAAPDASAENVPFEAQGALLSEAPKFEAAEASPDLPALTVLEGVPDVPAEPRPAPPKLPDLPQLANLAGPPAIEATKPMPAALPDLPALPQLSALAGPPGIVTARQVEEIAPVEMPVLRQPSELAEPPEIESVADPIPKSAELASIPIPMPRPNRPPRAQEPEKQAQKTNRETSAAPKKAAPAKKTKTASTASAGQPASTASAAEKNRYGRKLARHVQRHKSYPAAAKKKKIAGAAQLTITIGRSGGLAGARLSGSSGHAILDQEALAIARRASPYPRPPEGIGGSNFSFSVTLRFGR